MITQKGARETTDTADDEADLEAQDSDQSQSGSPAKTIQDIKPSEDKNKKTRRCNTRPKNTP